MSVIRVDNFGPSAGGTTYSARGIARAWINFNGTGTIAARDSENVSSLTDNGAGDYTVNIANDFAAADYAISFAGGIGAAATADNATAYLGISRRATAPSASGVRIASNFVDGAGSFVMNSDPEQVHVALHGDLA